jgi:hypothetical protein
MSCPAANAVRAKIRYELAVSFQTPGARLRTWYVLIY